MKVFCGDTTTASQAEDGGLHQKLDWIEKMSDSLMIVASLIATVSFQVFVNPPGGVWRDTKSGSFGDNLDSDIINDKDGDLHPKLDWIEKMSDSLMIVASLIATVSFQGDIATASQAEDGDLHPKLDWIEKMSDSLMIVASLIATVSFQGDIATASQAEDGDLHPKLDWIEKMSDSLMIVASLIATVSFQVLLVIIWIAISSMTVSYVIAAGVL
ncbi:hypothetical protein Dsin_006348 [Dipteronia sinensis]|uniref:PGG domain-containing protein n=1 Tax=Dipteronia sinensis TaxID=43782 RepID=A0AAE0AYD1_9ROSI|nr:hypothetical protein Dsin_006348 [Dipteronia sinensis]